MVSCCCTPIAIITGIAAVICFAVTPKVRGTRGNKAKAGLICGIIGIIGSVILITVFVVNILLSSDFQNEMKEFNTHYDTYIDENVLSFITGAKSLDEFDAFIETIKGMGIERCKDIKQSALDRYNAR